MASSSARQETSSSGSGLQINTGSSYVIKPKTMAITFESFEVEVESPVDFASLKRNGMNLDSLMAAQQLFAYFNMLNEPTYVKLVKDFWVRAEVYDVDAAKVEELQVVARDPSLKGKTRKETGLEPFRQTEIRLVVMGIPITITEEVIAKACRVALLADFFECQRKASPAGNLHNSGAERKPSNQTGGYRRSPQDASKVHDRLLLSEGRSI